MKHPAPSQLLVVLQNSLPGSIKLPANVTIAVKSCNCPHFLKDRLHNRMPLRPTVSSAVCSAPGQVGDMDNGIFDSPTGKFTGMIHVDEFSLKLSGGIFATMKPTAEDMIRKYVDSIDEHYNYVLFDLEGYFYFDSRLFHEFLEKLGTTLRFVPTGTHWANKASKAVDFAKVELASVFAEFPALSNDLAFKLAIKSVNQRVMSSYKLPRLEIHWGRKATAIKPEDIPLSALTAEALPPKLS